MSLEQNHFIVQVVFHMHFILLVYLTWFQSEDMACILNLLHSIKLCRLNAISVSLLIILSFQWLFYDEVHTLKWFYFAEHLHEKAHEILLLIG